MDHQEAVISDTNLIAGHRNDRKPADQIVRYDFVREANSWKIDDIRGSSDGGRGTGAGAGGGGGGGGGGGAGAVVGAG